MNSIEIEETLTRCQLTKQNFLGVFPCDKIGIKKLKPRKSICVNFCPSFHPTGCHWLVIRCSPNSRFLQVFDSSGLPTHKLNKYLQEYVAIQKKPIMWNNIPLQSDRSITCGNFCCVFLALCELNIPFKKIISLFDQNKLEKNDKKVMYLFKKIFK